MLIKRWNYKKEYSMEEIKLHLKTKYINESALITAGIYGDGAIALRATSLIGEPLATLTASIPDEIPGEGCVFLKDWSENEGIAECLVNSGIVELTGREVKCNYVTAKEAKLLFSVEDIVK